MWRGGLSHIHFCKGRNMPSVKQITAMALPVLIILAITYRVAPVRKVVIGA